MADEANGIILYREVHNVISDSSHETVFSKCSQRNHKNAEGFFLDLGLCNFFAKNFNAFDSRHDKGMLLENAVFRQLLDTHHKDDINFWRTSSQKEIDFIVGEKEAIEVKADTRSFKDKNLSMSLSSYPDMKFFLSTINATEETIGKYPIKNVWEI